MAGESDEFDENLEQLKRDVKQSFARVYANLKARELKTLRQLDAIRKQCPDDKNKTNCVQNYHISFENESTLLDNISKYGAIDFEKLNFDSKTFILENYVSPETDHLCSYKTIEDVPNREETEDLVAIQEAALKHVTTTENCVCKVNIKPEEVSKQFRNINTSISSVKVCDSCPSSLSANVVECVGSAESTDGDKSDNSDTDMKKIEPTDDWLNSIKNQTETEPSQVADVMEHSTITCV